MKAIFEVGDIVSLKSGSRKMVVTHVDYSERGDYAHVSVLWQQYETGVIQTASIPSSALVHAIRQEPESADVPFDQRAQGKYRR